ncbi:MULTISPECIES: TolB family protein [unclassified Nocardioides]|uniref:TolB family protein n=1 Tax=unclassified Nocardioides TaxID=2615069 RepID=UPI0006F31F28|nr:MULTISPECIES: PD40 domain-containing protein [unclassified Nocardioides]KRA37186.1 hypothetical protein ASD81_00070 [Nocardioides sp. Root614]KRA91148.1 hypothetical protein ASD84_00335 [Nocardioides sp. Root682]
MLHESLRELIVARGAGVIADAEEFRGALDDFLREDEATVGELNLLVDAVRLGAVQRFLTVVDQGADPAAAVREAGLSLARDRGTDDPGRSRWAVAVIGYALGRAPMSVVNDLIISESTQPTPPPPPPAVTPRAGTPPPPDSGPPRPTTVVAPSTAALPVEPVAQRPVPAPPPPPVPFDARRPARRGRGLLAALLVVALVAAIAGGVWWWRSGDGKTDDPNADETGSGDDNSSARAPGAIGDDELVLAMEVDGLTRVYRVGAQTGDATPITSGPLDQNPAISPDRRWIVTLLGDSGGKVPYVVDVASKGQARRLFPESGPCARADRVGWSPDGSRVAAVCVDATNAPLGLFVGLVDDQGTVAEPEEVDVPAAGSLKGALSWVSDSELVYQQYDTAKGSGLHVVDLDSGETRRITEEDGLFHGQPDYSSDRGLLLLAVGAKRLEPSAIVAVKPDGSDEQVLLADPVLYPTWSPDGSEIAFLRDGRLFIGPWDELGAAHELTGLPGPVSAPPVWGSR